MPVTSVSQLHLADVEVDRLLLRCQNFPVLGFDTEKSIKSGRNKADIMQLASLDGYCVIFQIACMTHFPKKLVNLMGDERILKVGVNVQDDVKMLANDGLIVRGSFDVRVLAKDLEVKGKYNLKDLAKEVTGMHLISYDYVNWKFWNMSVIPDSMLRYAAEDALAGVRIFDTLLNQYIDKNKLYLNSKKTIEQHFFQNGYFSEYLDAPITTKF